MSQPQRSQFRQLSAGPMEKLWRKLVYFDSRIHLSDLPVAFAICTLLVLMIQPHSGKSSLPALREGQVASHTVRVRRAIDVVDKEANEAEKLQILSRIPEVYDYDPDLISRSAENWKSAVRYLRSYRLRERNLAAKIKTFSTKAAIAVSPEEYTVLDRLKFSSDLERSIVFALAPIWGQKIVEGRRFSNSMIELVDIRSARSEILKGQTLGQMLSREEALSLLGKAGREGRPQINQQRSDMQRLPWSKWSSEERARVFAIQARYIQPNVTLNRKESEARRAAALKDFRPLVQKLAKGEVIVREGERVSRKASQLISELNKQSGLSRASTQLPYEIFFASLALWMILIFVRRQFPKTLAHHKNSLVAGAGLVLSLACFKLNLIFQLDILADNFPRIPAHFFLFMMPVMAPAMILRLLLNSSLTLIFAVLYGLSAAILLEKAALFGVYMLTSCLIASSFLAHCRTRGGLYRAGLKSAVFCGLLAAALVAAWGGKLPISPEAFSEVNDGLENAFQNALWAFFGGLLGAWLSSVITLVLTPILESLLDYTTDLKLLELARMDHPLLKELVLKAPGTYHHSIIVGSLVEAGAEAIGANALLARVGSYYHDIGKIGRAEYFIENQSRGHNPHDHTRPQLSAKIIISHVKEGKILAEAHKLGQSLIDFIEQHHGTTLVSYFYNKAKQEAAQPGSSISSQELSEEEFRYPGPKPQSKENAILALADSCEAATRSLVDPTPARIEGMVNKIIQKALNEGLLDEADITLREVHLVGQAFVRILLGIHHNRIQYPDQEKGLPQRVAGVKNTG